jgi:signal transduction histidine kinase
MTALPTPPRTDPVASGALIAALTVPSLASGAMLYAGALAMGQPLAAALAIGSTALALAFWMAASPVVVRLARRTHLAWRHVAAAIALAALHVLVLVGALISMHIDVRPLTPGQLLWDGLVVYLPFDGMTYAGLTVAVRLAAGRRQLADARLSALRMQLQPHFLFNALNAAVTLVRRQDNASAIAVLNRLADLLRHVVATESRPMVPLSEEVAFVANYLELERVRFGDRLSVAIDVAPDVAGVRVPTLLLQPLVENAVRHGVGPMEGPGSITISAAADGGALRITVRDTGCGVTTPDQPGTGLGLRNTRERLRQIYGDGASLRIANDPAGGVVAEVRLPR